jgi:UDP-3-O-[3-hydroxymyristoyl] glucosamine N-acyltransferase
MRLGDLAAAIGCELEGDPGVEVRGLAPIDEAGPADVTFVANERYVARARETRAAAVIAAPGVAVRGAALRTPDPYRAFVRALRLFHVPYRRPPGIHPTACIAPSARIGERAAIGPYAVIGENVSIGDDAWIDAHVVIYPNVTIGHRFVAHAGAVVREGVRIGDDVRLQPGAVIGGDGFGYLPDGQGGLEAIPQSGTVILEDGVEIGANTTIDRAAVGATRVRRGAKIDNLVMVGHGCDVGEFALLAGQVGLSGSTKIGARARLGGQVGAAGHLTIGAGAQVAAQSGVPNDVAPGAVVGGSPAIEIGRYRRVLAIWTNLPELVQRVRRIERALRIGKSGSD